MVRLRLRWNQRPIRQSLPEAIARPHMNRLHMKWKRLHTIARACFPREGVARRLRQSNGIPFQGGRSLP